MGLEAFRTEGPRKSKSTASGVSAEVVHTLKGSEPDKSDIPSTVITHEAEIRETIKGLVNTDTKDICVCKDCKRTTQGFSTMVKIDGLQFQGKSWFFDFKEEAIRAANHTDRVDALDKLTREQLDNESKIEENDISQTQEDDSSDETSTGLDSFKDLT